VIVAVCLGCGQRLQPVSTDFFSDNVELVEEYWPDGQLRLRKHVFLQDDGTAVNHGTYERWYDNGAREYEAVFAHGKKEGVTVRYHRNGQKQSQQEYKHGKRHGRCISWNAAGAKVKEESWAEGKPHGTWTVWENGELKWTHTYEHGDPEPGEGSDSEPGTPKAS
jgi:antitoxin component YwqK of YwqJK toxin-antitoxin module